MPPTLNINEIDTTVFEGLASDDTKICTIEATVPTGMEDVCLEEAREKLPISTIVAVTGKVFFDIAVEDVPKVLLLRSAENVQVVLHMEPNFPFTDSREDCFAKLYKLVEKPPWRKGVTVWQKVFGAMPEQQYFFDKDRPLVKKCQEPNPLLDLRLLKNGSPVAANLPDDIKKLREQHGHGNPGSTSKQSRRRKNKQKHDQATAEDQQPVAVAADQAALHAIAQTNGETVAAVKNGIRIHPNQAESVDQSENVNQISEEIEDIDISKVCKESLRIRIKSEEISESATSDSIVSSYSRAAEQPSVPLKSDSAPASCIEESASEGTSGPKFRVSCFRSGTEHTFGSQEGARQLGAAINDRFGWPVDLSNAQLEINLTIASMFVHVSVGLTRTPLFRRNLVAFGPTNLRATLCYSLVHLARPQPGDTVLDHMCGGASIPIEGAITFPSCFHLGGDMHRMAIDRCRSNLHHQVQERRQSLPADVVHWDATRLPLRDRCVDVVVSDLPFGKRSGSRLTNKQLYLQALQETARVAVPGTGRAVLLTYDRNSMIKNLMQVRQYWKSPSTRTVNIGGLHAAVFLLLRTTASYVAGTSPTTTDTNNQTSINTTDTGKIEQ